MQVRGVVVSVEMDIQIVKFNGGGATYPGARISYRDDAGALKEQAFHNNAFKFNAALKTSVANLTSGQVFFMEKEKNKSDFWEVKSISTEGQQPVNNSNSAPATTGAAAVVPKAFVSPKSTYETPEERAVKQILIVRQSALNYAINALSVGGKVPLNAAAIFGLADTFVAYIMQTKFDDGSMEEMEDDSEDVIQ